MSQIALDEAFTAPHMSTNVGDPQIWAGILDGRLRLAVQCDCCGRWLTDETSKARGRGPRCAARSGGPGDSTL